jgi:hypothetical protein
MEYLLLNGNVYDTVYDIRERMTCFWSDVLLECRGLFQGVFCPRLYFVEGLV